MTIEEIFKDSPELLEHKDVTALIAYVSEQHKKSVNILRKEKDFNSKIIDLCMNSEAIVINGTSYKDSINAIIELYGEY